MQAPPSDPDPAPRLQDLSAKVSELEAELIAKDQEIDRLKMEQESVYKMREAELRAMLNKRLAEVKAELQVASANTIKELEERLQAKQEELEALRTRKISQDVPSTNGSAPPVDNSNESQPAATGLELPSLTDDQIKLLVRENETVRGILRTNIRKAVDKEKEAFRKELEAVQTASGQPASNATTREFESKWTAEKDSLIKELNFKFESEKQSLIKAQEEKCAAEKQALLNQQKEKIVSEEDCRSGSVG